MANSKVSICNITLALLGADAIRSFDENNKRARMSDVFYESSRDYLLSKFDWPFAKKFVQLQEVVPSGYSAPEGLCIYQLPGDCKTPRDIHPKGSRQDWEVFGDKIYTTLTEGVWLYYTAKGENLSVNLFTEAFVQLLSLHMAVKMVMPITQDKALATEIKKQYADEQREAWESDANIGESYREYDEDPDNDSFVNPEVNSDYVGQV